jgi:hypothetical protein
MKNNAQVIKKIMVSSPQEIIDLCSRKNQAKRIKRSLADIYQHIHGSNVEKE